MLHSDFSSSSTEYVKVKGEGSPYDGNLVYWSTRMGKNPDLPLRKAILLKQQKGKCKWCGYHFREEDILEEDHIIPTSLGGRDEYKNLQLLHGHCHDQKTALDLIEIRKSEISNSLKDLDNFYKKVNYLWVDDILTIIPKAVIGLLTIDNTLSSRVMGNYQARFRMGGVEQKCSPRPCWGSSSTNFNI